MAGEVDDAAEQLLLVVPDADDADLRIDGAGRLDDVGVALAGMRDRAAVAHLEAAIEGHRRFAAATDAGVGGDAIVMGMTDRLDDSRFELRQVLGVGAVECW